MTDQPSYLRNAGPASPADVRAENTARLQSLQAVDRAVGSLVDTLDQAGVLDDTYIVFTSDNGYSLGEHRFVGKDVLTDEALQVPLLVRGPGIAPGSSTTGSSTPTRWSTWWTTRPTRTSGPPSSCAAASS